MIGFDVSRWQGVIAWKLLRRSHPDLSFCYVRVAGGWDGESPSWRVTDTRAADNLALARRLGLAVGTYLPVDPVGRTPEEAVVQAVAYLSAAGGFLPGNLVPALDIEDPTGDRSEWIADVLRYWRTAVGKACDNRIILYSSAEYFRTHLPTALHDTHGVTVGTWVADYTATPGRPGNTVGDTAVLHQYADTAELDGIAGNVALDAVVTGQHLTDWIMQP